MTTTPNSIFESVRAQRALVDEVIARGERRRALQRLWRRLLTPENEAALDAAIAAEAAAADAEAGVSRGITEWCLAGDVTFWPSEVADGTAWQTRARVRAWRDAFVTACRRGATVEDAHAAADAAEATADVS